MISSGMPLSAFSTNYSKETAYFAIQLSLRIPATASERSIRYILPPLNEPTHSSTVVILLANSGQIKVAATSFCFWEKPAVASDLQYVRQQSSGSPAMQLCVQHGDFVTTAFSHQHC